MSKKSTEHEQRDNPEWVAKRLAALDDLFEKESGRQIVFGQGAAAMLIPAPDTKAAVAASQHAADLRGLVGAARKGADKLPPDPGEKYSTATHAQRVEWLRAALAEEEALAAEEQRH